MEEFMALYRQPGSKVWWYEFRFNRQRIRESSKSTSKKIARAAELTHRRRLEEGYNGIKKAEAPKPFSAAAEELIEVRRPNLAASTMNIIERGVKHLLPFIGKKFLYDITPQDIQQVVADRRSHRASNRSINMTIETLRLVLRRNNQWERLRPDYKKLKEPKRVGKALSHEEEKRLLHECRLSPSRVLYPAVILGLYGGMRRDEIRSLQWHQIDLEKAFLVVGKSKTPHGENRVLPLIGPALQMIKIWAARFPNRLPNHNVFPAERYTSEVGKVYRHNPSKPMGSWRKAWGNAGERAGVRLRFHDLRHTAVTRMLQAGRTLEQIAPIMGWSARTMYEMSIRYAEWNIEAKRETMSALVTPSKQQSQRKAFRKESTEGIKGKPRVRRA
jgi:integrase